MRDERKTKEQLIDELRELRQRIAELEASEAKRNQAEEMLRRSEEKYRFLYEGGSTVNVVIGTDGMIKDVSNPLLGKLGYSKDEVVGKSALEFVVPEQSEEAAAQIEAAFKGKHTPEIDFNVFAKDGSLHTILFSPGQVILYEEERSTGVLFTGMDITDRKQVEEELRSSEEKYRALVENASEVILVAQDGMLKYVNPRATELTGYSEDELTSRPFAEFIHPDDREEAFELYLKRLKGEETPHVYPVRIIDKDGNMKWVSAGVASITWEGRPATMNFLVDITERERAEETLRESEEKLRRIVESSPDAIVVTDLSGNITDCNPAAMDMHNYSTKEELIGRSYLDLIAPRDRQRAAGTLEMIPELDSVENLEYACLTEDGREFPVELSASVLRDPSGNPASLVVMTKNTSDRKRAEEELLRIQKLESIGTLAGGIAHDFNNVLTGMLGNISLARIFMEAGRPTEKALERLREAERASTQAKDLTQQLLTFSRGGAPIKKTASIADLLRESATFSSIGSNVRCEFSIPGDLWRMEVDAGQMNQVISNIVINAVQAMPGGGMIRVCAENITVGPERRLPLKDGKYIKISIQDQGTGIPQEHLQRIFDPYFTMKQGSTGLGLATCYSIIRNHHGHITLESQVGAGTTFYVYLPASPESAQTEKRKVEEAPVIGEGTILVMDDEKHVRDLAGEMLSAIGYEVTTCIEGAEAVEMYREAMDSGNGFDAVIIDLTIPGGMGGRETIQKLIEIDPEVKAIVSSGYSNDPIMANFRECGFKGVIAKPYRIRELSEVLHRVITGAGD